MKLVLTQYGTFPQGSSGQRDPDSACVRITASELKPLESANAEEVESYEKLCIRLGLKSAEKRSKSRNTTNSGSNVLVSSQWLILHVRVFQAADSSEASGNQGLVYKLGVRVFPGPVTNALVDLFGTDVQIQVDFLHLSFGNSSGYRYGGSNYENISMPEMAIRQDENFACEGELTLSSDSILLAYNNSYALQGNIKITAIVDEKFASPCPLGGSVVSDKMQFFKKMLQDEIGCDVIIIPGKGKQVKGHKALLSTHSPVFSAMFQSDMKESKTQTVKVSDLSEQGVRGLLAYLYYWDESKPSSKPVVAFEMLYAAHKYEIQVLEDSMKKLLLSKPNKWYDADVAMKLFLLAKNLPSDGDRLKMKAIKVLKMNFATLEKSPTYANLFKENPAAAMELCKFAFAA